MFRAETKRHVRDMLVNKHGIESIGVEVNHDKRQLDMAASKNHQRFRSPARECVQRTQSNQPA